MSHKCCSPLGYNEKENNLAIRINSHKQFSNFSLEDWFAEHVVFKKGSIVFDIGCGNGNLFSCYSQKIGKNGLIVGIDQSPELLQEAKKQQCISSKLLLELDMNLKLPFVNASFNYCISSFAIYYANDVLSIVDEIMRLLVTGGETILIGPTNNNAKELYEFNEKVFGFPCDQKINRRTNRLENEFYPVFQKKFSHVSIEKIPSKLVFPSKKDFLKYYQATLLFEESVKKSGKTCYPEKISGIEVGIPEISKEMIVLRGRKNG
jgi:ubiquinone/menaquinone biosynthesis C-methylase UbiE